MKKIAFLFLTLLLPMVAGAEAVEIDGIYYNLVSKIKEAEVTKKPSGGYSGMIVIPTTVSYGDLTYNVTTVGENAFSYSSGLTSIILPNSIFKIENSAFRECISMTSIVIPNSVTTIGNDAFNGCYNLTSITIPDSLISIGITSFSGCSRMESISIPHSLSKIGHSAFKNCHSLKSVCISDLSAWCNISFGDEYSSPLFYAHHLFLNGNEIKDLVIPDSVTTIGNYSFQGGSNLTSVTFSNNITSIGKNAFYGCRALSSIEIPNSVIDIKNWVFYQCDSLTSVIIGDGVISIGDCAFSKCVSLSAVTMGNSLTNIGMEAFSNCIKLNSISIPNSVTSIGQAAFSGCSNITSLTIPNNVTTIGWSAFANCKGLATLIIGKSVNNIGNYAFRYCSGLTSVLIPNSVTNIGQSSFEGCGGITTIYIGDGIQTIGYNAFASCPELKDVYCFAGSVPNTTTTAFNDSYIEYATLHVPEESVQAYKEKAPWSNFKEIKGLDGTLPEEPDPQKCATPTIAYIDGKLVFDSETEGAEFVYEIKNTDTKKGYTKEVTLAPQVTTITVYATKTDYENSDVATATIGWRNGTPILEGFSSIKLEGVETNGDVNGDGTVDVADIATIISIMAGKTTQE